MAGKEGIGDQQARGLILAALAKGGLTANHCARQLDLSLRHVNRLLTELIKEGRIERSNTKPPVYRTLPGKPSGS